MTLSRQHLGALLIIACGVLMPAEAVAQQSGIAGAVRDVSGGALPGVTVEASSPALIEGSRTVVTDGQGLYTFVDLRPGAYVVTFTLPGFSTLRREGIELTAGFTATVNAELSLGTLEETITVSGEAPVVDIRNVRTQTTVDRETLTAIPTTGRVGQYAALIAGATLETTTLHDVGGVAGERGQFGVHGQRAGDISYVQDGVNTKIQTGGVFSLNNQTFQEVSIETSGMSAEAQTGGVQVKIVPRDGGNIFSGNMNAAFSDPGLQSENITDDLRARALTAAPGLKKLVDMGGGLGGPIKRDKLWFFYAYRYSSVGQFQQGNYYNKLQGIDISRDPVFDVFAYEPDLNQPAYTDDHYADHSLRLTWQAARKHKIVAAVTANKNCSCFMFLLAPQGGVLAAPEATGEHHYNPNTFPSVSWTFPATNRLLFESSVSMQAFHNTTKREPGVAPNVIQVTELANNYRWGSRAVSINTAGGNYTTLKREFYFQRATASYITGSHNLKAGFERSQYNLGRLPNRYRDADQINGARGYTVRNMVPTQITLWAVPYGEWETARDLALFAQDQWTVRKLTLNLGVRFNNFNGSIPEQTLPAGYFVPERHTEAVEDSPNWTNVNPRLGLAYDVFGTGKTAVKASLGRYTPRNTGAVGNPLQNMAQSANRTWTDGNRDFVPDCDLRSPVANGECGPLSDLTFGLVRPATVGRAPDSLGGFNKDSYNWQTSLALQHELRPNMALNLGYYRTWYGNFLVTDNLAVTPADYDHFCITAPTDSRLPDSVSGKPICGLYDIKPPKFGLVDNLVTQASHYGDRSEVFNGIDVSLNTRFGGGGIFQGGVSIGPDRRGQLRDRGLSAGRRHRLRLAERPRGDHSHGPRLLPGDAAVGGRDADEVHGGLPAALEPADERGLPEHSGHARQYDVPGGQRRDRAVARAQPGGAHQRRDRPCSTEHHLRAAAAAGGPAREPDVRGWEGTVDRESRSLQRAERQQCSQPDDPLRSAVDERRPGDGRPDAQVRRPVRFLINRPAGTRRAVRPGTLPRHEGTARRCDPDARTRRLYRSQRPRQRQAGRQFVLH